LREDDVQVWLPYDLPGPMRRFLRRFRPVLGVLMETEVWPNLAQACAAQNMPLLLANARLSARSTARWAAWPSLARSTFGALTAAAAQTSEDAARLRKLGVVDVSVLGNIKFDRISTPALHELGKQWKARVSRPILLLASTREHKGVAEEALLLDAMPADLLQRALLLVVPRHPQRMEAVHALLQLRGLRVVRRSQALPQPDTQVWLGDTLGEMSAYYAMADAAFIGGSLLPLGGQNLIEACAEGCPVVMGPHTFNFAQAVQQGVDAGAVVQVRDAPAVWSALLAWLGDAQSRDSASRAAQCFSEAHQGAAQAQAAWIDRYWHQGKADG
jgi:3-deoxy-D-manno-octulosonic-acid transferase